MMAGRESSKPCNQPRVRQQGSVPFLWEERPGTPKKDWKSHSQAIKARAFPPLPPPKLVASVPFKWEEKPGKPLPGFSQPEPDSQLLTPSPVKLSGFPYISFSSTSSSSTTCRKVANIFRTGIADDDEEEEGEEESEFDLDSLEFDIDEYPAVPVQQSPVEGSSQHGTPTSPLSETDSDTSSYATGRTSPVGAFFLERLFPLLPPGCGLEDGQHEMNTSPEQQTKEFRSESNRNLMVRRAPTLGELIMMSRKRSCKWNATQTSKESLALGLMKKSAFGCCFFGTSRNRMDDLYGRRQMQMLKLS
ncbi:hypothetical protein NE237_012850 [Protea cynaroides]|uniref:Hydroxyproline-rich glycoprotein family protein n=1 Tax=Protea cynaroides TaxID=273540 RepID=A0A9Q0H1U7_9MAGN|nr:hypothetical protein NE237_012850 [Protea cynaroides]